MGIIMTYIIGEKYNNRIVLDYLRIELSLSSKMITKLKKTENGILLCGKKVTVRALMIENDVLQLALLDTESSTNIVATPLPLTVIYEDSEILLVNKPAFMPTHPSINHYADTLANAVAYYYSVQNIPFVFRPITRLDRNTSGLVLIAKNKNSAKNLTESMQKGEIEKTYTAILDGELYEDGKIEAYINRPLNDIITRQICAGEDSGSAYSLTFYEIIKTKNAHTLVYAFPKTGRTHQLRLHFAHIGAPICGDYLYSNKAHEIERHALHATKLSFPHPLTKEKISFTCPLPEDMSELANKYFQNKDSNARRNNSN